MNWRNARSRPRRDGAVELRPCRACAGGPAGPGVVREGPEGQERGADPACDGLRPGAGLGALYQEGGRRASAAPSRRATRTGAPRPALRPSPTLISSDPPPAVLLVHTPDLNSYNKLFKKAQQAGIYVILVDNPSQLRRRRLRRQRLGQARPARGRGGRQGLRRQFLEADRPRAGRSGERRRASSNTPGS